MSFSARLLMCLSLVLGVAVMPAVAAAPVRPKAAPT